jgi:hypothetical protein
MRQLGIDTQVKQECSRVQRKILKELCHLPENPKIMALLTQLKQKESDDLGDDY